MGKLRTERPKNEQLAAAFSHAGYNVMDKDFSRTVARKMLTGKNRVIEWSAGNSTDPKKDLESKIGSVSRSINKHLSYDDCTSISGEWVLRYARFLNCSCDYLYGLISAPLPAETDIVAETGLSVRAIRQLRYLKKNSARMPIALQMLDTLDAILSRPDPMADFLQCVGNILGTCTYTASGGLVEDLPEIQTNDPAFIRVVQDRRLAMAIDNLKKTKK